METQYATMVGAICLDKSVDGDGNPAPVTFSVRKVINGHRPWQQGNGNMTLYQGADTLAWAVKELHHKFLMEMQERGYSFLETGDDFDGVHKFGGGTGWYSPNRIDFQENGGWVRYKHGPDYAICDYPLNWQQWVIQGRHSFAYDNYTVMIVTSNGDQVY